jgi:demethylmenaquinone methyltransferase/2-methoxy-6-polyprenyl-1,4-benzoquinol methylase
MGLTKSGENVSAKDHARRVREMFARISGRYDLLNHLLSANIDKRWRRVLFEKLRTLIPAEAAILDVACGTGDLTVALFENTGARVIGLDFCRPMLDLAAQKYPLLSFVEGDALQLPFGDAAFDAVTIGFGLRNLSSVEAGLSELRRVLRPGGRVAILEFSKPAIPGFRLLVTAYCNHLLPRIGGIISGSRSAYRYLPESVSRFPDQQTLADLMRTAGFDEVEFRNLTGGVVALHIGRRSAG